MNCKKMAIILRFMIVTIFVQCILGTQSSERKELHGHSNFIEKTQRSSSVAEARTGSGVYPCPDAAAILPCECISLDSISIACSNVNSEQIAAVFQQEFPVKHIYELLIMYSSQLTALDFDLNGVTLEILNVIECSIETVAPEFLAGSYETLNIVQITYSELTNEGFPFDTLSNYENLRQIILYNNKLDTMPIINSPSLLQLEIEFSNISQIVPGTFDGTPKMSSFIFSNNGIAELTEGTIPIRTLDSVVRINTLERIVPGAFYPTSEQGSMYEYELNRGSLTELLPGSIPIGWSTRFIDFEANEIAEVQPEAFQFLSYPPEDSIFLDFSANQLTLLEEDVFGPLMPYTRTAYFNANPLTCGCDIAWLVMNSTLMSKLIPLTYCADGTEIHLLDAEDYLDC